MKKIYIIALILGCLFIINFIISKRNTIKIFNNEDQQNVTQYDKEANIKEENNEIVFHIKGAIKNPGVYKINYGAYLQEGIDLAGGLASNANTNCLNLAQLIIPYQEITIPTTDESCLTYNDSNSDLININQASKQQLMELTGIGESKAQAIIEYRKQQPFQTIEDITNVDGISENLFNKIKDSITI